MAGRKRRKWDRRSKKEDVRWKRKTEDGKWKIEVCVVKDTNIQILYFESATVDCGFCILHSTFATC